MRESDELVALADEKGASFWKALGMLMQGWLFALDRQSLGRSPDDHLWDHRIAVNGSNIVYAVVSIAFGEQPMRNSANSMRLGAASAKR